MRRYETIAIFDPDLTDEDRKGLFAHVKDLIPQQGGALIEFDEWGEKRLAYDIKKKGRGYYVRIDFGGDGALVAEMERQFRIDDRVMKYMTVLLEKDYDIQAFQDQSAEVESDDDQKDDDLKENDASIDDDDDDFDDDDFDDDDFDNKSDV